MNVLVDARQHKAANMNGRAVAWAYLFRLYVCDKEIWKKNSKNVVYIFSV